MAKHHAIWFYLIKYLLFASFICTIALTLVFAVFFWVEIGRDEERRVEFFANVILVITVTIVDILSVITAFGNFSQLSHYN